jgi:hypothetical protein
LLVLQVSLSCHNPVEGVGAAARTFSHSHSIYCHPTHIDPSAKNDENPTERVIFFA